MNHAWLRASEVWCVAAAWAWRTEEEDSENSWVHSKHWVVSPTFLEPGDYDVEDWLELIRRNMVYLVSVAEERQDLTSSVIQAL